MEVYICNLALVTFCLHLFGLLSSQSISFPSTDVVVFSSRHRRRLEAMARESSVSASASDPQATGEIPLIWCTECGGGRILKRTSRKSWSLGQVFYCCPNYKRDGAGCPFWYWENDYIKKIGKMAPMMLL